MVTVLACTLCTAALALHFRSVLRELRWALRTSENCRSAVERFGQTMSEQSLRQDQVESLARAAFSGWSRLDARTLADIRREISSISVEVAEDAAEQGLHGGERELYAAAAQPDAD
jgi:hypothetical protein